MKYITIFIALLPIAFCKSIPERLTQELKSQHTCVQARKNLKTDIAQSADVYFQLTKPIFSMLDNFKDIEPADLEAAIAYANTNEPKFNIKDIKNRLALLSKEFDKNPLKDTKAELAKDFQNKLVKLGIVSPSNANSSSEPQNNADTHRFHAISTPKLAKQLAGLLNYFAAIQNGQNGAENKYFNLITPTVTEVYQFAAVGVLRVVQQVVLGIERYANMAEAKSGLPFLGFVITPSLEKLATRTVGLLQSLLKKVNIPYSTLVVAACNQKELDVRRATTSSELLPVAYNAIIQQYALTAANFPKTDKSQAQNETTPMPGIAANSWRQGPQIPIAWQLSVGAVVSAVATEGSGEFYETDFFDLPENGTEAKNFKQDVNFSLEAFANASLHCQIAALDGAFCTDNDAEDVAQHLLHQAHASGNSAEEPIIQESSRLFRSNFVNDIISKVPENKSGPRESPSRHTILCAAMPEKSKCYALPNGKIIVELDAVFATGDHNTNPLEDELTDFLKILAQRNLRTGKQFLLEIEGYASFLECTDTTGLNFASKQDLGNLHAYYYDTKENEKRSLDAVAVIDKQNLVTFPDCNSQLSIKRSLRVAKFLLESKNSKIKPFTITSITGYGDHISRQTPPDYPKDRSASILITEY